MELIPILATIILVSTISTFILAIGAYILYKVRERRGRQVAVPQPDKIQAELLTPEAQERGLTQEAGMQAEQIVYEQPIVPEPQEPIFVQHRATIPQPVQTRFTPSQQYVAQKQDQQQPVKQQTSSKTAEQKFLKITSEGYVPLKDNKKDAGALKWR